jgi:hypothetical protein
MIARLGLIDVQESQINVNVANGTTMSVVATGRVAIPLVNGKG